ncbi:transposase [Catenulispora sp. NL8]|uniref:Transposase n=1 Tax=Catenulispora pinistramenti TaxID=2705254 RepID=A0ABS5KN08_9ACTN|nr:transposase [Catenulispora pinistramenti]
MERKCRIDQLWFAVVVEAYIHGLSTRSVDELVKAVGVDTGISKSQMSKQVFPDPALLERLTGAVLADPR